MHHGRVLEQAIGTRPSCPSLFELERNFSSCTLWTIELAKVHFFLLFVFFLMNILIRASFLISIGLLSYENSNAVSQNCFFLCLTIITADMPLFCLLSFLNQFVSVEQTSTVTSRYRSLLQIIFFWGLLFFLPPLFLFYSKVSTILTLIVSYYYELLWFFIYFYKSALVMILLFISGSYLGLLVCSSPIKTWISMQS